MSAPTPPDDVSTLMMRVDLDHSQYKVFDGHSESPREAGASSQTGFQASARAHSRAPRSSDLQAQTQQAPRPRWNVLNSLLDSGCKEQPAAVREALLVPMLTVTGGSGGVGKTTILTSLARVLSAMGENLMLVFSDSQRTLPLYFGGQQVVSGRVRTFVPSARHSGELHFYARPLEDGGVAEAVGCWLPGQVNALAEEVGRVLCEVSSSEISEREALSLSIINLRVIIPDISSVLAVNRDVSEPDSERDGQTFYLLNKFDSSIAFHRDVRERLSVTLGERLLPFTIRRTDQIPEALAAGTTVMDYASGTGIVQDFESLAKWLRGVMPRKEVQTRRPIF